MNHNKYEKFVSHEDKLFTGVETAMIIAAVAGAGATVYAASQKPPTPPPPPPAPTMQTGAAAASTSTKTLAEDNSKVSNSRATARKGAAAYRIPLQAQATGFKTSGGSGLNI